MKGRAVHATIVAHHVYGSYREHVVHPCIEVSRVAVDVYQAFVLTIQVRRQRPTSVHLKAQFPISWVNCIGLHTLPDDVAISTSDKFSFWNFCKTGSGSLYTSIVTPAIEHAVGQHDRGFTADLDELFVNAVADILKL
jgi:hypothetical protein